MSVSLCTAALVIGSYSSYGHTAYTSFVELGNVKPFQYSHCKKFLDQKFSVSNRNTTKLEKSQVAAAGILFGARYALHSSYSEQDQKRHQKVHAIKNYRSCQKEAMLEHNI